MVYTCFFEIVFCVGSCNIAFKLNLKKNLVKVDQKFVFVLQIVIQPVFLKKNCFIYNELASWLRTFIERRWIKKIHWS